MTDSTAGETLLRTLEALVEEPGRGQPEKLTTQAARDLLTQGLGLKSQQIAEEYRCLSIGRSVDLAVAYDDDEFYRNREYPKIIFEFKRHNYSLNFGSREYFKVVDQLKKYMWSKECIDVEHGVIFNIRQLQIFRKHKKLIYPVTQVIDLQNCIENKIYDDKIRIINDTISYLKEILIEKPQKYKQHSQGTVITVWNNKGGVGKTTVAYFLSWLLSNPTSHRINLLNSLINQKKEYYRILAIDFDHNQGDLTRNFNCDLRKHKGKMLELLKVVSRSGDLDRSKLEKFIIPILAQQNGCWKNVSVDLLAADISLCDHKIGYQYQEQFLEDRLILKKLCLLAKTYYDYIIIDAPPNYQQNIYAREAVNAADCLLPIAFWGGHNSLENYYSVVCDLLPRSRSIRGDGGPENLGLWINCAKLSDDVIKRQTSEHIKNLIDKAEKEKQEELKRSFYQDKNLRLIRISSAIRAGKYWYKQSKDIYADLLTSILGEGK